MHVEHSTQLDTLAKSQDRQGSTPFRIGRTALADNDDVASVGFGQGCGHGASSRAALRAVKELEFDLRRLQRGGTLHILVEIALGRPLDEILPGIHLIWDTVGAPCNYDIDFEFSEDLDDEVLISLIVCRS
jgi:hypothetical protein